MKRILFLLIILSSVPAHAGFMTGFIIGSAGKNNSSALASLGIPPACYYMADRNSYVSCRGRSAIESYGMTLGENMAGVEWDKIIRPMQTEYESQPKN